MGEVVYLMKVRCGGLLYETCSKVGYFLYMLLHFGNNQLI